MLGRQSQQSRESSRSNSDALRAIKAGRTSFDHQPITVNPYESYNSKAAMKIVQESQDVPLSGFGLQGKAFSNRSKTPFVNMRAS